MKKNWEVLKCDNCGAPMKPSGRSAECSYCGTVYVRGGETSPRDTDFTFNVAPRMSAFGWIPMADAVNPLALGVAPPMSGEEGWIDSYGNRY